MKRSWTPPPPPKCPRVVTQTLPRRPRRLRLNQLDGILRANVCPPMDLVHPSIVPCLTQEAPRQPSPAQITNGANKAPRVPLVLQPLVPLGPIEIPRRDAFGSTIPVPSVGRGHADGGMPVPVVPRKAKVVPPALMPRACAEMVATAARTTTVPLTVHEPPRRIVLPTAYTTTSPSELMEWTTLFFPELQAAATLITASCDVPSSCPRSDGQLATKPCRIGVAATFPLLKNRQETRQFSGGEAVEVLARHDLGAIGDCCDAPVLGWIPAMQEAMDDIPQGMPQSSSPPISVPCVPVVPEYMAAAMGNVGTVGAGGEPPRLMPQIRYMASLALEILDVGISGPAEVDKAPPCINRETIRPRPLLLHRRPDPEEVFSQPLWRDGKSDDEVGVQRVSPRPLWRDSENTSPPLREAAAACPSREYQRDPRGRSTPSAAPRRHSGDIAPSRSLSPLGALLRRAYAHSAIRVSNKLKKGKHQRASDRRNQRRKDAATTRRKKSGGKAVWKDTPTLAESTNDVLRTINLTAFMADMQLVAEEGSSRRIIADRPPPHQNRFPRVTRDKAVAPAPSPAREINSRLWREVAREGRGGTLAFDDASPIAVLRPGGPRLRQSRSRRLVARSGSVLSVATSSATAAAWKSIASIPDDLPPSSSHSSNTSARCPHKQASSSTEGDEQRRSLLEECAGKAVSPSRKTPRERPRAPAFEPWGSRDETPRPSPTEVTADDLNLEWYSRSGRDGEEAETVSLPRLDEARRHEGYASRRDSSRNDARKCHYQTAELGDNNDSLPVGRYGAPTGAPRQAGEREQWRMLAGMDRALSRSDSFRRRPSNNRCL